MKKVDDHSLTNQETSDEVLLEISPELDLLCERIANLLVDQIVLAEKENFDRKEDKMDN